MAFKEALIYFKEALIYSSFRRMPESMSLKSLDPGIRRDDDEVINQRFLKNPALARFASLPTGQGCEAAL